MDRVFHAAFAYDWGTSATMMGGVHALVGAALGGLCRTRGQAVIGGAVSHLVADALPHRDLEVPEEAVLLGVAFGLVGVVRGWSSREFAGAVGAVLPDVENLAARALGIPERRLLLPTHKKYHGRRTRGFRKQFGLGLGCLAMLLALRFHCAEERESGNSS